MRVAHFPYTPRRLVEHDVILQGFGMQSYLYRTAWHLALLEGSCADAGACGHHCIEHRWSVSLATLMLSSLLWREQINKYR